MFVANLRAEPHSLCARLMGPVEAQTPFASPWRAVLLGDRPGDLLEHNYLLQNLSPPSRVTPTDWIRPGKVLREVTLSTKGGREAVDFAVRHGLQYIEFDAGWYGTNTRKPPTRGASTSIPSACGRSRSTRGWTWPR